VDYYLRIHYDWRASPILGQVRSLEEAVSILSQPTAREILWQMVDEAKKVGISDNQVVDWQSKALDQLSFNVPDFWFLYWFFWDTYEVVIVGDAIIVRTGCFIGVEITGCNFPHSLFIVE
jgi:hypothetical protein